MSSCVVKNKAFYFLAEEHEVDGNELELIVHKYWNEVGKEDSFPPSSYINEQLGINKTYEETGENVKKLWEREYNRPLQLKSQYELNSAVKKAKTFFPADAITTYKDNKGNFIMRVARPINTKESLKVQQQEIQKGTYLSKTEGYESVQATLKQYIDGIDKSGEFGQALQKFIDEYGTEEVANLIINFTPRGHRGSWNNVNRTLKLAFMNTASHEERAAVLLHELLHSKTSGLAGLYEKSKGLKTLRYKGRDRVVTSNLSKDALTPELAKAFNNLVECKAEVLKYLEENPELKEALLSPDIEGNLNKRPLYAILTETNKYSVREFISEIFSNPAFIKLLKDIPVKTDVKASSKSTSLWERIKSILRNIFGKSENTISVLDRAQENAEVILRASKNIDTAFKTVSEDVSTLPIGQQRAQLTNYYVESQKVTPEEFKQVRSLASHAFKKNHYFKTSESAKAVADKFIRENHIDSDMIVGAYGYKLPNSKVFTPYIKWRDFNDYSSRKYNSAKKYAESLRSTDVESEVIRLAAEGELEDSSFTFNDGTTITTPFELNDQQKVALQKLDDFCESDRTTITLSGYAGTGKTSLMEMIAKKVSRRHEIVFSATTHRAAGVLKSKVESLGFNVKTVQSLFGIIVQTELGGNKYDASKKVTTEGLDKVPYGGVIIIDESSMLDDDNYSTVVSIAAAKGAKVIFVGDPAQLSPVKQKDISIVFRQKEEDKLELTKVERTGDNAILKEATAIRNGKSMSYESSFNSKGQGVAYMNPRSTSMINNLIEKLVPGLSTNSNYLRILAYTNDAVTAYNEKVRLVLGNDSHTPPQVGEVMIGYDNWGWQKGPNPYKFVNSASYKVVRTSPTSEKQMVRLSDNTIAVVDVLPLTLKDDFGEEVTVPYMDIKGNVDNKNATKLIAQDKVKLWNKWRVSTNKQERQECLNRINELEKFLFVNDNIYDGSVTLQKKIIDFGYASTIHKSQGDTCTNVIIDEVDIEAHESDTKIQRRLRYVGVSRATDTVTVISADTKTEDSPLNHIQESPAEANSNNIGTTRPVNPSVPTINIWAKSGENAHLSNFAERSFSHTWSNGKTTKFHSVEQAFHFVKAMFAKDRDAARKILETTDGAKLKFLGRQVKGLDVKGWDNYKYAYMKAFIKESFMQNPEALAKLQETGEATLTHNQDKGEWKQKFPQILMDVREELRGYKPASQPVVAPTAEKANNTFTSLQDRQVQPIIQAPTTVGTTDMLPPISSTDIDINSPANQIPTANLEGPLKGFTLHSGGAKGADFTWGKIGAEYGVEGKHYYDSNDTRQGKRPEYANTPITDEDRTLGERKAFRAGKQMGRLGKKAQKITDPLLIRDWNQVNSADMVVAIAQKFNMPGEKFSNKSDDDRVALVPQVSGGTGWAVQMAIAEGKPVYVFNQAEGKWYVNFMGVWNYSEAPVLSENFAGIGTRAIGDSGVAAIRECYEKTVKAITQGTFASNTEQQAASSKQSFNRDSLSKEMQEEFDRLTQRTTQINNILSSEVMTPTEAREIVESLMNLISDYITEVINDPAINNARIKEQGNEAYLNSLLVNQNFAGAITPFNPKGLSRLEIINRIGIDNIVNIFLKNRLISTANTTPRQRRKMKVLSENLDALLYLGANTLAINEGIHLVSTRIEGKELRSVENGVFINPDLNSASDTESMQENEGSLQEKWQVDSRTIDVVESMSQLVRNELFKLYQLDKYGNKIRNSIGVYKRIPVQETTKQILSWCQGALTLKDVVARLKSKQRENPWVSQLIEKLDVETLGSIAGEYSDFQNSFFSVFNKHFQPYSATIISYDDGVPHIKRISLNEKPFMKETLGQIRMDIAAGVHPLFNANNTVNRLSLEKFKIILDTLHTIRDRKIIKLGFDKMTDQEKQMAFDAISQASAVLGYPVDVMTLSDHLSGRDVREMIEHLGNIYDDVLANAANTNYDPLSYTKGENGKKGSGIKGSLSKFLTPLTQHLADISVSSIFDNGKMYQSYVTPSYMTKLALKFAETDQLKFNEFIQAEYGKYEWFKNESGWRGGWIGILAKDATSRKIFKHEVKLNYNKHSYMKEMSGNEYIMSLLSSFFSEGAGNGRENAVAWYRIPMLSNKPSEEYIRFYADMGIDFKEKISSKMAKVFDQELSRIQTVRIQGYEESDPRYIKNFHENGKRFCFLDFMNVYLDQGSKANTTLGKLINEKLNSESWSTSKEPLLAELAQKAIQASMEARIKEIMDGYEARGIMEIAKNIEGINQGFGKDDIAANIERFLWNDAYATTQILEMTVTDIAFYKDMEDLQKRIAQIHSPGIRGNAEALDYSGRRVSDGYERTIYLTDFAKVKSNIIDNVKIVFDRKLEELKKQSLDQLSSTKLKTDEDIQKAQEAQKARIAAQEELYKSIIKQFEDINVADAQGYSSPTSYRKKMFIFGKWSKEAENIYQRLITGDYNYHDLQVAFQPLKPFVYSQISKSTGLQNGPLRNIKVPVQNKNSEYLLIMADAILQGEQTGQPNLLRAIYETMEESATGPMRTKGIDTVQFESAVKSGLMGRNDINRVLTGGKWNELIEVKDPKTGKKTKRTRGEVFAKVYLRHNLYTKDANGIVTGYNSTFVHEIPFEDYCIQQEVPEHFKDHAQQHGSQIRMITPSDLLSIDANGQPITYEVEGRQASAQDFRAEYEKTIAENIQASIDKLYKDLHLNTANQVERNIILSRMLQDEILSSPRYGLDMYLACSLDSTTGEFRIPLGDPIQANRVEQLLNSIIKKRVNEQKIAGGPVVQVSNFGTSRRLNIRFKNKNGKKGELLKTREEFEKSWKPNASMQNNKQNISKLANQIMQQEKLSYSIALKEAKRRLESPDTETDVNTAYEKYIKENQGGIAYFEVFAPIFDDTTFKRFANPDGTVDIQAMEEVCPEALQMVGYRIPTEDKYSCAPIKIVGFLPREAGEGIMLPYDITLLTGSDFDVDKEYLMRKQVHVNLKSFTDQYTALEPYFLELKKKESKLKRDFTPQERANLKYELSDMIDMFRSNDNRRSYLREAGSSDIEKKMWDIFKRVGYDIAKSSEGKEYRDNKIFDMTWEVLSHESVADKLLNPGGFEEQKKMAYLIEAYKNTKDSPDSSSWEELSAKSTEDLKALSYNTKNLIFLDSQVQFYEQNNAASSILGMFAVQKIAHATLESNGYQINIDDTCGFTGPFTLMGKQFQGIMEFDAMLDDEGNVVGKTLGSHVAAAADAAKEPCMNLLNINSYTTNAYSVLLRLGMPFRQASLFMAQPIITELLANYNKKNLTGWTSLDAVLDEYMQEFRKEGNMYNSTLEQEEITEDELINNLRENRAETNYKVASVFARLQRIADALKGPTYITRYNSITNAVGPLITDNIVTDFKTNYKPSNVYDKNGNELSAEIIFSDHPILKEFAEAYRAADRVFEDFPTKSEAFAEVLNSIPGVLRDTFLHDRTLLNGLKDFFLSHTLIDNRVVNENRAGYYVKEFAQEFVKNQIKEKNLDNDFIQKIKAKQDKDTEEYSLELSTTGMNQREKDKLSASWYELYKKNKVLAMDLFNYNFFKGGIGFNPKTFMNLLPLQMREDIQGYKESFTHIPTQASEFIFEQFLAHSTSSYKLFPFREEVIDPTIGGAIIEGDVAKRLKDVSSFRAKDSNNRWRYYLYDKGNPESGMAYKEIIPLGGNGEFLEMSSTRVPNISLQEIYGVNRKSKKRNAPVSSEITANSNQPLETTDKGNITPTPAQEKFNAERLIKGMIGIYPGVVNSEIGKVTLLQIKEGVVDIDNPVVWKYLSASGEAQGIILSKDKVKDILKDLC